MVQVYVLCLGHHRSCSCAQKSKCVQGPSYHLLELDLVDSGAKPRICHRRRDSGPEEMKGRRLQPSVDAVLDDVGVARRCDCASPEEKNPQSLPENYRGGIQLLQGSAWLSWCWPHVQERALGSLSCSFVVHGQLLSLQRPKTNRLPKPVDRVPLRVCQCFCLWTGYHLAP